MLTRVGEAAERQAMALATVLAQQAPLMVEAVATPTAWREAGVGMVATYQAGRNASEPA